MDKKESSLTKSIINNWSFVLILCVTLGLAPFTPEPHFIGKINWIAGGATGMKLIDWGDFIFHGLPWFLLIRLIFSSLKVKPSKV